MSRFVALPVMVVALAGAYYSVAYGLADIYAERSLNESKIWRGQDTPALDTWQVSVQYLETALYLAPDHPTYHVRMAQLYRTKISWDVLDREERQQAGKKALEHLRSSLRTRPYWGPAWADLALTKALIGEFDREYIDAFSNSISFGPWEPRVLHIVLSLAVADKDRVGSNELTPLIIDSYIRAFRSPVSGVSDRALTRLQAHSEVHLPVINGLLPFLTNAWQRGKIDDYHKVSDWIWPFLEAGERRALLEVLYAAVRDYRRPAYWMRFTTNDDLRAAVCKKFMRDGEAEVQGYCRLS